MNSLISVPLWKLVVSDEGALFAVFRWSECLYLEQKAHRQQSPLESESRTGCSVEAAKIGPEEAKAFLFN